MTLAGLAIAREAISATRLTDLVTAEAAARGVAHGAVALFLGAVRAENLGRRVTHLEYEAYEPLAVKSFELIASEAAEKWPGVVLAIYHRLGRLEIGEISVGIAALSAHRAEAFAASRYAIERVKQIAPIWKREAFEGGEIWIEGATADPRDEGARLEAFRRACA
ncbi:MAG: molybdenum cofactor biosynthesis protein MoaE [Acidobacteria bacterium]|nr:molybdenum cofactor biosynthesis protein MoaE [Acidobacteriota bacterium]